MGEPSLRGSAERKGNAMNRVDGVGEASIFRGDPRAVRDQTDLETWLNGLLERGKEGVIEARPHLYGSDAGFCARRNVLLQHNSWLGNTINSAGRGYMAIGVAFEGLLVEALQRAGRVLATQYQPPVEALANLHISAKLDVLALDAQDQVALLEVKTCGELPESGKPAHTAQAQMYAALSGVRNTHLVYMSRNLRPKAALPLRTFPVDTSDEALLRVLQIANESYLAGGGSGVDDSLSRRRGVPSLPPVPGYFRKHTECHYCEFRDHFCWGSRPGLGDNPSNPPLREFTPEEYIRLAARAAERARGHLAGMPERYLETLRELDLAGATR